MKKILFVLILVLMASLVFAHGDVDDGHEEELNLPVGLQKLIDYQNNLALKITFLMALLAGIISFTSPCSFALYPAFFSILFKERKKATFMASAFCLGLVIGFTIIGIIVGIIGESLNQFKQQISFFSAALLLLFAVMIFFNKGFGFLNFKVQHKPNGGFWSVVLLGLVFTVGWTPCIGPILVGVLILAANLGNVMLSGLMLLVYAIGISIPLILLSTVANRFDFGKTKFVSKHIKVFGQKTHWYNVVGGILLAVVGLIILFTSGTGFIEQKISIATNWQMSWFYGLNDWLVTSDFLASTTGNIIGLLIAVAVIVSGYYFIRKHMR